MMEKQIIHGYLASVYLLIGLAFLGIAFSYSNQTVTVIWVIGGLVNVFNAGFHAYRAFIE